MPKGFHFGRTQTRHYVSEYYSISAITFKQVIGAVKGNYRIDGLSKNLTDEHASFSLVSNNRWEHIALFTIKGQEIPVPLQHDNRSASNKLYLVCPYCVKNCLRLYALKTTYACRGCAKLHYPSQSEREPERLARKIRKNRKAIWGNNVSGIDDLFSSSYWPKPKGMRHNTFKQKRDALLKIEERHRVLLNEQIKAITGNTTNLADNDVLIN